MSFHVCFCLPVVVPVIIKTPKLWPTCKWLDCSSVNAWRWWTRPAGHQELLGIITQLSGPEVLVLWAFHGGYAGCWLLKARFLVAKIDGKAHMNSGKSDFCRSYIWFSPHFRVIPNQQICCFTVVQPVESGEMHWVHGKNARKKPPFSWQGNTRPFPPF